MSLSAESRVSFLVAVPADVAEFHQPLLVESLAMEEQYGSGVVKPPTFLTSPRTSSGRLPWSPETPLQFLSAEESAILQQAIEKNAARARIVETSSHLL